MRAHKPCLVLIVATVAAIGLVHCSPVKSDMLKIGESDTGSNSSGGSSSSTPDPVNATVIGSSSAPEADSVGSVTSQQRATLQTFRTQGRFPISSISNNNLNESGFKVVLYVNQPDDVIDSSWQSVKMNIQPDMTTNTIYLVLSGDVQNIDLLKKNTTRIEFTANPSSGLAVVAAGS